MRFAFDVTKNGLTLDALGHRRHFHWLGHQRKMAKKIKEEGPLAACLSILYEKQGWFNEAHKEDIKAWDGHLHNGGPCRVPPPRRHGGKGRSTSGGGPFYPVVGTEAKPSDIPFMKEGLGLDFSPVVKEHGGSQRDSETGESCHWPEAEKQWLRDHFSKSVVPKETGKPCICGAVDDPMKGQGHNHGETKGMDFGRALFWLKKGQKVTRPEWSKAAHMKKGVGYSFELVNETNVYPGWNPSHGDLFAEDWELVE